MNPGVIGGGDLVLRRRTSAPAFRSPTRMRGRARAARFGADATFSTGTDVEGVDDPAILFAD
jgi:hypothetical protein